MVTLGIGITAAIVAGLVAGYFRVRRRRRFPAHGWLGFVALAGAEWLLFHHVEPVATYFTPISWSAYILMADAATFAITGRSRLNDAPLSLARMALLSIPLWLIFEGYNLRLENWEYVGVPLPWAAAMVGYGWSFATITPAIFETSDLVQAMLPTVGGEPWKVSRSVETAMMICGAACLIVPLVTPRAVAAHLFALVWVGFLLLLDPINRRLELPSFSGCGIRLRVALGILELLGSGEMALHVSDVSRHEDFRDACAGISGISTLCAGVLHHVR